jgi:hypothetical protein
MLLTNFDPRRGFLSMTRAGLIRMPGFSNASGLKPAIFALYGKAEAVPFPVVPFHNFCSVLATRD